jgi:hypothetical protein
MLAVFLKHKMCQPVAPWTLGAAAEAIPGRFIKLVPGKTLPEPDDVEQLTDDQLINDWTLRISEYITYENPIMEGV